MDLPIPEKLRERFFEEVVDRLSKGVELLPGGKKVAQQLRKLRHDHDFNQSLQQAFLSATESFITDFALEDPELTQKLKTKTEFFENEEIRNYLVDLLRDPEGARGKSYAIPVSFNILFSGIDPKRIEKAISVYIQHLAKAVWKIPEFHDTYSLTFQRITAEAAQGQLVLAREQLKVSQDIKCLLEQIKAPISAPALPPLQGNSLQLPSPAQGTSVPSEKLEAPRPASANGSSSLTNNLRTALDGTSSWLIDEERERLGNADIVTLQIIINSKINEFIRLYRRFGNPLLVYRAAITLVNASSVHVDKKPYELGRLHAFLGYLLINADPDIKAIAQARSHLEQALDIFDNQKHFSDELIGNYLRASWLHVVAVKMMGDFGGALNILSDRINDKQIKRFAGIEHTIPLIRQRAIMEQTASARKELGDNLDSYRHNAVEHFHTLRRLFEFALNSRDTRELDSLYKRCQAAFSKAKKSLDHVYIYSYLKVVYHYFMLSDNYTQAGVLYQRITKETEELSLLGQNRQIRSIAQMFDTRPREEIQLTSSVHLAN